MYKIEQFLKSLTGMVSQSGSSKRGHRFVTETPALRPLVSVGKLDVQILGSTGNVRSLTTASLHCTQTRTLQAGLAWVRPFSVPDAACPTLQPVVKLGSRGPAP